MGPWSRLFWLPIVLLFWTGMLFPELLDTARLRDGKRADLRGRRIGFIFQEYNLLPSLNVVQNVMLPLR